MVKLFGVFGVWVAAMNAALDLPVSESQWAWPTLEVRADFSVCQEQRIQMFSDNENCYAHIIKRIGRDNYQCGFFLQNAVGGVRLDMHFYSRENAVFFEKICPNDVCRYAGEDVCGEHGNIFLSGPHALVLGSSARGLYCFVEKKMGFLVSALIEHNSDDLSLIFKPQSLFLDEQICETGECFFGKKGLAELMFDYCAGLHMTVERRLVSDVLEIGPKEQAVSAHVIFNPKVGEASWLFKRYFGREYITVFPCLERISLDKKFGYLLRVRESESNSLSGISAEYYVGYYLAQSCKQRCTLTLFVQKGEQSYPHAPMPLDKTIGAWSVRAKRLDPAACWQVRVLENTIELFYAVEPSLELVLQLCTDPRDEREIFHIFNACDANSGGATFTNRPFSCRLDPPVHKRSYPVIEMPLRGVGCVQMGALIQNGAPNFSLFWPHLPALGSIPIYCAVHKLDSDAGASFAEKGSLNVLVGSAVHKINSDADAKSRGKCYMSVFIGGVVGEPALVTLPLGENDLSGASLLLKKRFVGDKTRLILDLPESICLNFTWIPERSFFCVDVVLEEHMQNLCVLFLHPTRCKPVAPFGVPWGEYWCAGRIDASVYKDDVRELLRSSYFLLEGGILNFCDGISWGKNFDMLSWTTAFQEDLAQYTLLVERRSEEKLCTISYHRGSIKDHFKSVHKMLYYNSDRKSIELYSAPERLQDISAESEEEVVDFREWPMENMKSDVEKCPQYLGLDEGRFLFKVPDAYIFWIVPLHQAVMCDPFAIVFGEVGRAHQTGVPPAKRRQCSH